MNTSAVSQNKMINYMLVTSVILIWGITFVSTKYLLRSFSSLEILIVRFLMAYATLWIMKRETLKLTQKKDEFWFIIAGLSGVTVYQFLENVAISFTLPANVSIIVSICPMITAIIAQIFLKEKHLNLLFVIGFVTAIIGIALVSFNGTVVLHLSPKGDLLAFGAAVCWGFYSLSVSKINSMKLNPVLTVRRTFFWALIAMIPLAICGIIQNNPQSSIFVNLNRAENVQRWGDFLNWFNLGFLGFGASAFAFAVWNFVCRNLGTVKVTVFIYLSPVVTIVFAFLALGDKITFMGSIGAALTICGLVLSERSKKSKKAVMDAE